MGLKEAMWFQISSRYEPTGPEPMLQGDMEPIRRLDGSGMVIGFQRELPHDMRWWHPMHVLTERESRQWFLGTFFEKFITLRCHYSAVNIYPYPYSSTGRGRYGVSFVNINSDVYFASIIVVPYAKFCYDGPRYNGTQLKYSAVLL